MLVDRYPREDVFARVPVSSQRFGESSTCDRVLQHAVSTGMGPY